MYNPQQALPYRAKVVLGKSPVKAFLCLSVLLGAAGCYPSVDPPPPVDAGICTSDRFWDGGHALTKEQRDGGDVAMHPGRACLDCHYNVEDVVGGKFEAAGTIYTKDREIDDCVQAPVTGGKVEILYEDGGMAFSIIVDKSGNFLNRTKMPVPYKARVTLNGKSRDMTTAQTLADCNYCHTWRGGVQSSPGRILWP